MDREQQTGLYFQMAKHLTTLDTAAILVFLAASEEASLPLWPGRAAPRRRSFTVLASLGLV